MPEIILVRHGETQYNASETFRGRLDVPLNENGLRQAQLLADYLSSEKIDVVYSSPLQRAIRTAEAVAAPHRLKVAITESLNDMDFGEWQGLTINEVKEKYGEIYQDWLDTPEQVRLPGGETLEDIRSRVLPFVQDAVMRSGEGKIVLVSHRVVNKVLICALLRLDNDSFWSFKMDTAAITRLSFDGNRVTLTAHNDTSFLRSLDSATQVDF